MDWKCHWKFTTTKTSNVTALSSSSYCYPWLLYCLLLLVLMISPIRTSNNACDWTGSGLSTTHADREIVSIYLRCTAGKIVWNYPKGAIRVLLRSPIGLHRHFRACLKIHQTKLQQPQFANKDNYTINTTSATTTTTTNNIKNQTSLNNDLIHSNRIARIFLEGPKRLIALYDNDDKQIVKCFRSINEQVALYVEAEEMPFENLQTIFEYNLEFINNKHHSIRPLDVTTTTVPPSYDRKPSNYVDRKNAATDHHQQHGVQIEIDEHDDSEDDRNGTWWWWRWGERKNDNKNKMISNDHHGKTHSKSSIGEDIIGALGESWEICRPCTDTEMAHAYCSSDIVSRGIIYSVQEQPVLDTIEITVKHTKILRNNMIAISDAEDVWRHYYKTFKNGAEHSTEYNNHKIRHSKNKKRMNDDGSSRSSSNSVTNYKNTVNSDQKSELKFHTPSHCSASHGIGEFVFMGRRRFDELMLICAPRLDEWVLIARQFNESNNAPCILQS